MCIDQSRRTAQRFTLPSEGTRQSKPVVRLDTSQVDLLATVLSRACQDEAKFKYLMPDEQTRRAVLPWFFGSVAIRASHLYGEIYTTENIDGAALWISPGHASNIGQIVRTGMPAMPFKLEPASCKRCIRVIARVEAVHERLAGRPHWYLVALGAELSKGRAIRKALIEPVLARADSDGLPCYLETFDENSVLFYENLGFRIEGAGQIPWGGPNFWAMMRAPQASL